VEGVRDRAGHVGRALSRIRAVTAERGLPGAVLTAPGPVAWATGGVNQPIDRSAGVDVVWLAVGADRACLVTTEVEEPRLAAEHTPEALGLELLAVPWWDAQAFGQAAAGVCGATEAELGSDGHPGFGHDLGLELTRARLALDGWERDRLGDLGRDAAAAVEDALREWRPGQLDRDVAARIAGAVEASGGTAPVLLVGGDERLRRFRHPVAVGARLYDIVMAVLVAARDGQHVALTRYACAASPTPELAAGLAATRRVHRRVLATCRPDVTAGEALTELAAGYAAEGAAGAWRQHYQGGPIGYAQREFEIAPVQTASPWWGTALPRHCAVAWNPSLPGGAKDEDTYLIRDGAPDLVTTTRRSGDPDSTRPWPDPATPDWPLADDLLPARPAVLVAGT
jgi:Xaa-Pro dipeptidase